jgi:hypothetical protein
VLHAFAIVGIDNVNEAVFGLDHRGVTIFTEVTLPSDLLGLRTGFVFESENRFPDVTVF